MEIDKEPSQRSSHLVYSYQWFQDLMAVRSPVEATSLRSESSNIVTGGSQPVCVEKLVSVVLGCVSRGHGTELGVGLCLDALVECLYVDDGKECLGFAEVGDVNAQTPDMAILSDLVASGEAYTVMSALELLWILSPNRQVVRQLVEAIDLSSLSVSAHWTKRMANDIRLCLAVLVESIARLPSQF